MSQSVAQEDLALSTSKANEAAPSFSRTGSTRVAHPVPHLVGAPKGHLRPDTVEDKAEPAATHSSSTPQHVESHSDPHWTHRAATARPSKGLAHEALKRVVDIAGALLIAVVFSPLILPVILILWCQGGPIIYKHRRIGRGGQVFECLKFRTMVPNADQALRDLLEEHPELKLEWVRDHKLRNDPRVTAIGRFLRRTSLDELPQLWNVIRGEMSLVGPRPIVREELLRYGRNVRDYLAAKPGITGLWQVMGRNDTDYRRRVVLDTYYVRNHNLILDLYILVKTTLVVLGRTGAY
jgi:Undecaprenyl-phosphate galactose phosphotransferase WbaP